MKTTQHVDWGPRITGVAFRGQQEQAPQLATSRVKSFSVHSTEPSTPRARHHDMFRSGWRNPKLCHCAGSEIKHDCGPGVHSLLTHSSLAKSGPEAMDSSSLHSLRWTIHLRLPTYRDRSRRPHATHRR